MSDETRTVAEMQALILGEARRLGLPWRMAAALHVIPRRVVRDWLKDNVLGFRDAYESARKAHQDEMIDKIRRHAETKPGAAAWLRRHGYSLKGE
jgi:hypothetical protein